MLRKFVAFLLLVFSLFTIHYTQFTATAVAEGEFSTDFDVTYKVAETGVSTVSNRITLTNIFSNLYATSYSLVLDSMDPKNIHAYDENGALTINVSNEDKTTTIQINFTDTMVGKDKSRTFWIVYEESSFAIRTGEVWEISIPRISEDATFSSYFATLSVPESFGEEAYLSPQALNKSFSDGFRHYKFTKSHLEKTGVVAGFGQFQVFSFTLNYHLENPLSKTATTQIAIPPDTAFQKVYYDKLDPKPNNIQVDADGNWIAYYELKARERVDVTSSGSVQIFSTLRHFPKPTSETLQKNLLPTNFWQADNEKIKSLTAENNTALKIYNYVSQTLNYDYSRVKPNIERLGALAALSQPQSAICMEFTDLFIAMSRASGIPAREINGFAYTENPDIQPLSLVNDVLHAWPEYYDDKKQNWIPVDPTWGSTTGGVDFFNKLDLRHFTFVIHGVDDTKPYAPGSYKLGSNPQKDVFVSFGSLPENRNSKPMVRASVGGWIPFIPNRLKVNIANPGPVALYGLKPKVYFDNNKINNDFYIETLLPFQTFEMDVDIPFSFLGTNTPDIVTVNVEGETISVQTNKNQVVIYNLLFIFVSGILILLTLMFRLKKWKIKLPHFQKSK